jgi:hypothetical protein
VSENPTGGNPSPAPAPPPALALAQASPFILFVLDASTQETNSLCETTPSPFLRTATRNQQTRSKQTQTKPSNKRMPKQQKSRQAKIKTEKEQIHENTK